MFGFKAPKFKTIASDKLNRMELKRATMVRKHT